MNHVIAAALLITLFGAHLTHAQQPGEYSLSPGDAERWKRNVTVKGAGEFDRVIELNGARGADGNLYGRPARQWSLVTLVAKATGVRTHMLYFSDIYTGSGWRFWKFADTDEAESLRVNEIKRDVSTCGRYTGCLYSEFISIHLPEAMLDKRRDKGLRLRLRGAGNAEDYIVSLSAEQVGDQVDAARSEAEKITSKIAK